MLQFTRIQTAAILVIVLVICGFTAPNFVSDETIRGWPDWAQRRITLAPELQGGTSVLLEVDRNDVREQVLASLFREVRDVLHDARIMASHVTIRSGSVEVRPHAGDFEVALAKLRELWQPLNGVRSVEVTNAGGGLIRLIPTEAHISEYEPLMVNQSVDSIRARIRAIRAMFDLPATAVEREGAGRVRVQVPKLGPDILNRIPK
jgi:preprotein translocase subunit SecD